MDGILQKFRSSRQPAVQLEIAMEEYFRPELPEPERAEYEKYLRMRIRSVAEVLILQEDTEKLSYLSERGFLPLGELDQFLKIAADDHKNASFRWLMQVKQEKVGFKKIDFSL